VIVHAILLGLFGGVFGLVYLLVIETGTHAIWPEPDEFEWFSGGLRTLLIPLAAGVIVGILYKVLKLPARFKGFIAELEEGHVDPKSAPGAVLIAIISLLGGASLGPEAPLATAAGGAGTWLSQRTGGNDLDTRVATFSGISGVFGGLLSTPIGGPLIAFELEHRQTSAYYYQEIVPGAIAGAVGFAVMWPVIGTPMVGLYQFETVAFRDWMLLAGAGIGIVAGLAALLVGKVMVAVVSLMRGLDTRPVARGLIGGAAVGLIGFAMPITLLSGVRGLESVFEQPEAIGVALLLGFVLLKAVSLGASLGAGFYGGPIFPIFFMGGSLGAAIHLMLPEIPLQLAAGCAMAAMAAAIAMIPISVALIGTFLVQGGLLQSAAIVVAVVTAYALRYALAPPGRESDAARSAAAKPDAPSTESTEVPV
jgi:H+/Cl- antiporter ClcA